MQTKTPNTKLSGGINVIRLEDDYHIGKIDIDSDIIRGWRYQGIYGGEERKYFDNFRDAQEWVSATENIPLLCPSNPDVKSTIHGPRILICELHDGLFIGIHPNAKGGPAVYAGPDHKGNFRSRDNAVFRTKSGWNIRFRGSAAGKRKKMTSALLRLAELFGPETSGHGRMSHETNVMAPLRKRIERGDFDLVSELVPVDFNSKTV